MPESPELPVVAVLWNTLATSPFLVTGAAHGLCDLVGVVDSTDEASASYTRLLKRFGTIVDPHGHGVEDGAERVDDLAEGLRGLGVRGVLALNDAPLRLGAALAQRLGSPFHSPATAKLRS